MKTGSVAGHGAAEPLVGTHLGSQRPATDLDQSMPRCVTVAVANSQDRCIKILL